MDTWQYKPARDLGMPMGQRLRSTRRESGLVGKIAQRAGSTVIAGFLRWCERMTIHGRENLPASLPFVLISNHCSHLDALVLASMVPKHLRGKVFSIAAGDTFFQTPAQATLSAALLNALPMWRKNCGRHGIEELRQRLVQEPCGFILFPEGTRSRNGDMGPFKAGIGMLVAAAPVPVVPCLLQGTHNAWPPTARLPRIGAKITVHIGAPAQFENASNDREGWNQIATELEHRIRNMKSP